MARSLYTVPPTAAEAATFGFTVEQLEDEIGIWPDNLAIVNVFMAMATQWRTGYAGATGLDYNAVPVVMRLCSVPAADRPAVFHGVRVMEDAALAQLRRT